MWAFSVCPPLRSWLDAHLAELEGKRLGLLASNLGTRAEPLKAKFEEEFRALDAFAVIAERRPQAEKDGILAEFLARLSPGAATSGS
jgi:hypothetical protein